MLYTFRSFKTWGGRSARGQWSNVYHVNSVAPIDDAELAAAATSIVTHEKNFHLNKVNFMRVVISTYQHEGRSGHPEAVKPIEMSGVGARNIPDGVDPLPLDVAFVIKTGAATGRNGQMKFRGVLLESDVVAGGSGNFIIPGVINWGGAGDLNQIMTGPPPVKLQLPSPGETGLPGRDIVAFTNAGVMVQKTTNRRKKKKTANENNVLDYLDEILAVVGVVASIYFTRGGAIAPVARAAAAARLGALAGIIGQIVDHLTELATGDPVT